MKTILKVAGGATLVLLIGAAVIWWLLRPQIVAVGQRHVEAKVQGTGSPAVVFEGGFTGDRILWWRIQNRIARETLTLTYERAGLGRSDPGPEPRSAEQIARELHALLGAEAIAPPYILVGHSAGGLYVRVYAHMYPQEIAGLVLVDPATEDYYDRMRAQKSAEDLQKMGLPPGALAQWRALDESLDQARHAWPLPAVPTVVLTSGKPLGAWPLETEDDMRVWSDSHNALVANIPGSTHVIIQNADHLNILNEDAVCEGISTVIAAAKRS